MGDVVVLDGVTRLPIPPERVLEGALKNNIKTAVVLGWDEEGMFYFASSEPDGAEVLWLLELAKKKLMEAGG